MKESFLQYIWRYQLLKKGELHTTDGQEVRVVSPGELNLDAGPDFFNAHIVVGGIDWHGNIEVHKKASDWDSHGHTADKSYNNVILHVVLEADAEIKTEEGRVLPTLELRSQVPDKVFENYETLMNQQEAAEVACAKQLPQLPSFMLNSYLERLAVERLVQKTEVIQRLLDEARGGWETCCYWLLARYFGGKTNAFPFELLAKATDIRLLARWKNDPERLEAILFGQAGMLDEYFNDEYPRRLQADYQALRAGANLKPISAHLWKNFRLRPPSFPTIRISQFAQLISKSSGLFSKLLETTEVDRLLQFFDVEASQYWQTHYLFDKESARRTKGVGKDFARMLIINAWVPLLFEYGRQHGDEATKERALDLLNQLPPEKNRITTLWQSLGIETGNATQTQALLQLYNNYCTQNKCLQCHIGYQVLKQK